MHVYLCFVVIVPLFVSYSKTVMTDSHPKCRMLYHHHDILTINTIQCGAMLQVLTPDHWFEAAVVWELQAADLSKSSAHTGAYHTSCCLG